MDYRNGVYWCQWDPAKWLIAFLKIFGLTWDLEKKSRFLVLKARLETQQQRLRNLLASAEKPTRLERYYENLEDGYRPGRKGRRSIRPYFPERSRRSIKVLSVPQNLK